MRFAFTVPDTIGDFVLRQPLFAALAERGHSVALVMRSFVVPLTPLIAPQADVFPVRGNPYSPDFAEKMQEEISPIVDGLRDWKPDAIVVAPFQRTVLDEYIVERLSPIPSLGMSGILYPGAIEYGLNQISKISLTQQVTVQEQDLELLKNEALCRMLIGESISLPAPALQVPAALARSAMSWMENARLEQGPFWVVCAGNNSSTRVKNWQPSHWSQVAKTLVDEFGMSLLFVGTPDEDAPVAEILRLMGTAAEHCVNTCGAPPNLNLLPGILALSAGYLGKDTGPMHLAAALRKPVLAVFGGGHWPRFIPAADCGAAVTCAVPCSGCGWNCHFDESHCVKDVPIEPVIQELRRIIAGNGGFRMIVVEPDTKKLEEMGLEAATLARARLRGMNGELIASRAALQASRAEGNGLQEMRRDLQQLVQHKTSEATALVEQLRESNQQVEQRASEATALGEQLRQAGEQLHQADEQLRQADEQLRQADEQLRQANEQLCRVNQQVEQKASEAMTLREQLRQANEQLSRVNQQVEQKASEVTALGLVLREVNQEVEQISLEATNLRHLLESIRRSVFTRILVALGIWRVFSPERPRS
jgi:ADP-heptose:LPS heptosyltransferase/archaellum component FlaC